VNAATRRAVDLSSTIAKLPGMDTQDFTAHWSD
jgi:hypothetical protein